MEFCDKLQKIRKENNITQEGLADKLGVSRQAVSKWESGTAYPDTEKLIQISKLFKVSLDELINDNVDTTKNNPKKKFNFMEAFNIGWNYVSKVFSMFWAMKFWEKCKFLIEMFLVVLAVYICSMLSTSIITGIIRRIFMFLPLNVTNVLIYILETLMYIIWLILGVVIFARVLKTRYLDYYVIITDDTIDKQVTEEPIRELKEKKETKVVIRDPKHSGFSFFSSLGKLFMFLIKCLCVLLLIPVVICFIAVMILLVISLAYLFSGIFFNGISIAILGGILFIYLLIYFLYNIIFDRKTNYTKLFIIFIVSISLMGIGTGMTVTSFNDFNVYEKEEFKKVETTLDIPMESNLIIDDIIDAPEGQIVIDNNSDRIKFAITVYDYEKPYINIYNVYNHETEKNYRIANIYVTYNDLDYYKMVVNDFKNKKINTYTLNNRFSNGYEIDKIYISEKNLNKIKENIKEMDY